MGCSSGPDVVEDGLVLCLDAASKRSYGGSGTTWTDTVGQKNIALQNGPTFSSDNGGVINFDGSNDQTEVFSLGTFSSFSVAVWFNPTYVQSYRNVIDCNFLSYSNVGNVGPRLEMNDNGNIAWIYSNNTTNNSVYYYHTVVSSGLQSNKWHNIAISYNSTNNTSETYYGGISSGISRQAAGSPTGWVGQMPSVVVGRGFYLQSRFFVGKLGIVQIYNRALTADEIRRNYLSTKERYQ